MRPNDIGERRADGEDRRPSAMRLVERARVLEGVGGIGVEEAAAIGAELLDGDLGGDRPERDGLLAALQRRRHRRRRRGSAARPCQTRASASDDEIGSRT